MSKKVFQSTLNKEFPSILKLIPGEFINIDRMNVYSTFEEVLIDNKGENIPIKIILPLGTSIYKYNVNTLVKGTLKVFKNEGNRIILLYQPLYNDLLSMTPKELNNNNKLIEKDSINNKLIKKEIEKIALRLEKETGSKLSEDIIIANYFLIDLALDLITEDDDKGWEILSFFTMNKEEDINDFLKRNNLSFWEWKNNYLYRL